MQTIKVDSECSAPEIAKAVNAALLQNTFNVYAVLPNGTKLRLIGARSRLFTLQVQTLGKGAWEKFQSGWIIEIS